MCVPFGRRCYGGEGIHKTLSTVVMAAIHTVIVRQVPNTTPIMKGKNDLLLGDGSGFVGICFSNQTSSSTASSGSESMGVALLGRMTECMGGGGSGTCCGKTMVSNVVGRALD